MLKKEEKIRLYVFYSILFAILSSILVGFYRLSDNLMIDFGGDGFRQHFRALLYYSQLLKNILAGKTAFPEWDFVIGEGSDILQTLHYYGIGDPLLLLSAFCPERYMPYFYEFLAFLKLYLMGISFSILCFCTKKGTILSILTGMLIYAFCGFSLTNLSSHTIFLSSMVCLPLIIAGVENIIQKKSPLLLSLAVCLSSLSNIYLFYMNVIMTVFYVMIRILVMKKGFKESFFIVLKIFLYSLLGLLMSAVIFLPMSYTLLNNSRLSSDYERSLFFDLPYYRNVFISLTFSFNSFFGNLTLLAPCGLTVLFSRKGKTTLKSLTVFSAVMISIPFFSSLLNGMTYESSRWIYGISLLIAYIVTDCFDQIMGLSLKALSVPVLYYLICIFFNRSLWQVYVLYLAGTIVLYLSDRIFKNKKTSGYIALMAAFGSILFTLVYTYSPLWWNIAQDGTPIDQTDRLLYEHQELLDQIDDEDFWRYNGDLEDNYSINSSHPSGQFYWSIANDAVTDFRRQVGSLDHNNHHYDDYDDIFVLNALSCTKYFVKENSHLPVYESVLLKKESDYSLYRNEFALPPVYVFEKTLSLDNWQAMDIVSRQEVLSRYVVTEDGDDHKDIGLLHSEVPYSLDYNHAMISRDHMELHSDSSFTIEINDDKDGEYYLVFEGIEAEDSFNLIITGEDHSEKKLLYFKNEDYAGYAGKHNFIINLGYYEGIDEKIHLRSFPADTSFSFSSMKIICQPLQGQLQEIEELRSSINIKDLSLDHGNVSADIEMKNNGILCFAIPFSSGWSATADGSPVSLQRADLMYMGLSLEKGGHTISLHYHTPMLKAGAMISLASILCFLFLAIRQKHKGSFKS